MSSEDHPVPAVAGNDKVIENEENEDVDADEDGVEQVGEEGRNKRGEQRGRKRKAQWTWKGPRGKQVISKSAAMIWLGGIPKAMANEKQMHQILRNHTPNDMLQPDLLRVYPKQYKSKVTNERVGYAFIIAATQEDADRLIKEWDGKELARNFIAEAKPGSCENAVENPHSEDWDEAGDPSLESQLQPLNPEKIKSRLAEGEQKGHPKENFVALVEKLRSNPRTEKRFEGVPVPQELYDKALNVLQKTIWPGMSNRGSVNAENYLVLQVKEGQPAKKIYEELHSVAIELLRWIDPEYPVSAIAITKNFAGSPHIDNRDRRFQYALSLGDFQGGELCVEDLDPSSVWVVNTRGKMARVDGRCIHWVRKPSGGDRYSLIWYSSYDELELPVTFAVDTTLSAPSTS